MVIEGNIINKNKNKVEGRRCQILFEKKLFDCELGEMDNDLVAYPDCLIAEADYSKFKKCIGGDIKVAQRKSLQLNSIENISFFKILS